MVNRLVTGDTCSMLCSEIWTTWHHGQLWKGGWCWCHMPFDMMFRWPMRVRTESRATKEHPSWSRSQGFYSQIFALEQFPPWYGELWTPCQLFASQATCHYVWSTFTGRMVLGMRLAIHQIHATRMTMASRLAMGLRWGPRIDKDAKEAETRPVETVTQTDAPRTPRNRASKRKFDEKKKDKDANEKKIRKTRSRRKMMAQQNSGHWLSLCETKGSWSCKNPSWCDRQKSTKYGRWGWQV